MRLGRPLDYNKRNNGNSFLKVSMAVFMATYFSSDVTSSSSNNGLLINDHRSCDESNTPLDLIVSFGHLS